jgi:hypothetical protein
MLHRRGDLAGALEAYDRGEPLATGANWRALVARPRLLAGLGRADEAAQALRKLHRASWDNDPWLMLEAAWRELPPPVTDTLQLAGDDYGAVRGFLHPRGLDPGLTRHRLEFMRWDWTSGPQPPEGAHRWTHGRAHVRFMPATRAERYAVTVVAGVPFPSTLGTATGTLRARGGETVPLTLDRTLRPFTVTAPAGEIDLTIEAPTWSRAGEPADQGARVDRVEVRALR